MKLHTIVAITGLLPLGCSSAELTCPEQVVAGADCAAEMLYCPQQSLDESGCGVSGFTCIEGTWHEKLLACNPPPPPPEPACPATIASRTPCGAEGQYCSMPDLDESSCGVSGFTCTDGQWTEQLTTCNPPPLPETPTPH